jgi:hypothetical protein
MRAMTVVMVCLAAGGCAPAPAAVGWFRADGKVADPTQRQLAETICKGEVEKAAAQGHSVGTMDRVIGPDRQDTQIFAGCMAQQGYIAMSLR